LLGAESTSASQLPGFDHRQAPSVRLVDDLQDPELATVMGAPLNQVISFARDGG
jgi:hypothetical protein